MTRQHLWVAQFVVAFTTCLANGDLGVVACGYVGLRQATATMGSICLIYWWSRR